MTAIDGSDTEVASEPDTMSGRETARDDYVSVREEALRVGPKVMNSIDGRDNWSRSCYISLTQNVWCISKQRVYQHYFHNQKRTETSCRSKIGRVDIKRDKSHHSRHLKVQRRIENLCTIQKRRLSLENENIMTKILSKLHLFSDEFMATEEKEGKANTVSYHL